MKNLIPLALIFLLFYSCKVSHKQTTTSSTTIEAANTKTFYVAPITVDCEGAGLQKCLLIKRKITDRWQLFYDNIEGFQHEWGNTYIIKVKETKLDSVSADASSLKHTLVEIVEKDQGEQELINLYDIYGVVKVNGKAVNEGYYLTLEINTKNMQIMGSGGCNTFNGSIEKTDNWNGINFKNIVSTKMYCPNQKDENTYLKALSRITSYYKYNNSLLLFTDNDVVIEARRMD